MHHLKFCQQVVGAAAAAAAALTFIACGASDSDKAADVTTHYMNAIYEKNYGDACDDLTARARKELVDSAGILGGANCEAIMKTVFSLTDESVFEKLKDPDVGSVKVDGDEATVTVNGAQPARLQKVGGDWKINEVV